MKQKHAAILALVVMLVSAFTTIGITATAQASVPDVSGTWTGVAENPGYYHSATLKLTQSGNRVQGTWTLRVTNAPNDPQAVGDIGTYSVSGSVDATGTVTTQGSLTTGPSYYGQKMSVIWQLSPDGNTLSVLSAGNSKATLTRTAGPGPQGSSGPGPLASSGPGPQGSSYMWAILAGLVLVGALGVTRARSARRSKQAPGGGVGPFDLGKTGVDTGPGDSGQTQAFTETRLASRDQSAPVSFPAELTSQYSSVRYLGEGGFARVFGALNLQGVPVAVKVLKTSDPKAGKLFMTEAANWNLLHHENIVRLLNFNIFPVPHLESELCDDSVEREMIRGTIGLGRAVEIVTQIGRGLSYAHKLKVLHGDIKPSNMLIKDNVVKISDWGLSKIKTEHSVSITGVTLQYAAPEELSGQFGGADERTDIYQLGVMFYQLVTGQLPFGEDSSLFDAILQREPTPPCRLCATSPELEGIILRCLKKRKEERYQTVDELLRDLERLTS
ncbi:MAG: serine/threonine-protein kinase [Halobacteriota archaeon]